MKKYLRIIAVLLVFITIILGRLKVNNNKIEIKGYDIHGVIQKVEYEQKGIPTIIVNNKSYYIDAGWALNNKLQVGDSIFKNEGQNKFIIYKIDKGQYITYEDEE